MHRSKVLIHVLLMAVPFSGTAQQEASKASQPARQGTKGSIHDATYSWRVIEAPNGTYGYEVLRDGRTVVRQTSIPGLPGVEGCSTPEQAMALAEMVVARLQCGEMPPTLTRQEVYFVVGR